MEIDWTSLLQNYGYLTVLIGAFFEGETVLLLGAYAVQQEIFNFWWLILAGALGALIGDQFYYHIGSKFGHDFINTRPNLAKKFEKASFLIEKYPTITILCMRFAWGLRTIIPISFGIKKYNYTHYLCINVIASLIWATTIVSIGLKVTHWLHSIWETTLHEHLAVLITSLLIGAFLLIITYKFFYLKKVNKSL